MLPTRSLLCLEQFKLQFGMKEFNEESDSPHEQKQTQPGQDEQRPINRSQNRYKSFQGVLLLIINMSLSSFYFGYTIIYLNVIQFDTVMKIFNINMQKSQAEGFLTFCVPLGGLFGSFLSSYFISNISRKNSILYINYAAFVIGILIFFTDLRTYMILRFCQGMCAGLFSAIVPLLIKQTAPFELSGFFGTFQQLFITIGIFVSCFLSFILSKAYADPSGQSYWKIIFAFPLIAIVIQTFMLHFVFTFETPKYLILNNQQEEARRAVSYIYQEQFVQQVIQQYKNQAQTSQRDESSDEGPKNELYITKIVALHLSLLQQFVGISAVATYAGEIADGNLSSFKPILPSIVNFEQVVTAIISSFLLKKYGRKLILQYGTIGAIITNFIIGMGFFMMGSSPKLSVALILIGLFCYMANFGLSLGPIVWLYIPQIVDASFLPYSTMVNWGGSALSILLFPIIKAQLPQENPALLFIFFALWSLVSFFINKKYIVQTKNKQASQIRREFTLKQQKYCT